MKPINTASALLLWASLLPFVAQADPNIKPELKDKAKQAVELGLNFLKDHQAENGSWSNSVGLTSLGLNAFLESSQKHSEAEALISKPVKFILSQVKPDGSITESQKDVSYNTAIAITALKETNNPAYADIISNGQKYLKGIQYDEHKQCAQG